MDTTLQENGVHTMPSIDPLPQPTDLSNTSVVTWVLGLFLAVIAWLWRKSEGQSVAAVNLLSARLTEAEKEVKLTKTRHEECEESKHAVLTELAITKVMAQNNSDRLNDLERQFVRKAD